IWTPAASPPRRWGPDDGADRATAARGTISGPTGVGPVGGGRTTGVAMTRTSGTQGGRVTLSREGLPSWLDPVARAAETVAPRQLSRFLPPENGAGRQSAVLILFGDGER